MLIVPMTAEHAERVLAIYQAGIDGGDATFETMAPTWAEFDAGRLPDHRFVALDSAVDGALDSAVDGAPDGSSEPTGEVVGWVAVSRVSSRPAYAGVVEHSVYVDPAARGLGVGRALLQAVIDSTEAAGIWTIQSGVFPENRASLRLHAQAGFREVGVRERIARRDGRWRDVVLLERRSPVVT